MQVSLLCFCSVSILFLFLFVKGIFGGFIGFVGTAGAVRWPFCRAAAARGTTASRGGDGGNGGFAPGASYFSRAGKVTKSALRGAARADFAGGKVL